MVLDQGYWPDSILTPPSDEAIQYDIRMTKEMGFNGARKHQKLEDPRCLYWADKMGLLVSSEMANAYLFDDESVERFTRGMDGGSGARLQPPVDHHLGAHQRELGRAEPARSAAAESSEGTVRADALPRFHAPGGRQRWLGAYRHDGPVRHPRLCAHRRSCSSKIQEPQATRSVVPDGRALAPGYKYNGSPILLSEFGGIAFIPQGHEVPSESWGYSGVEKTDAAVLDRLRGLYKAIAKMPAIVGHLLHAAHRRRTGNQRPDDIRPQTQIFVRSHASNQRASPMTRRPSAYHGAMRISVLALLVFSLAAADLESPSGHRTTPPTLNSVSPLGLARGVTTEIDRRRAEPREDQRHLLQ